VGGLTAAGLTARLDAVIGLAAARVSAAAPLELRGPFGRKSAPAYFLRNASAGVFAGDVYEVSATAEAGVAAQVASSSAAKVHAMPAGEARTSTRINALAGSSLTWGPHTTILQAGSHLRQETRVRLNAGARVTLAEVLVLGRIAAGESCVFGSFDSSLTVAATCDTPLYEERYAIEPGHMLSSSLGGYGVVVSVYVLGASSGELRGRLADAVRADGEVYAGVSALPNDAGFAVRGLAASLSKGEALAVTCIDAASTHLS